MRQLVNFVIRNKLAIWILTIVISFSGLYSASKMKMEMIPDISIPFLMVITPYPGATAEQVMNDVSIPLENAIEGLENVRAIYVNSSANLANVQVEYEYGIDMDEAKRSLQTAIDNLTFPQGVDSPTITAISMNMMPVVLMSISSKNEDIVELTKTVEQSILPRVEQVEGVANVAISGQHIEEIHLTFDEKLMHQYGLTKDTVEQMIQASNLAVSFGLYEFKGGEEAVRLDGKFPSINDLMEMVIPVKPTLAWQSPFIKLKDIAQVEVIGKVESISRTNGEEAIALQIIKEQEANTVDVVNRVKDLMKNEFNDEHLLIDITLNQAKPIEDSVYTMVEKAVFGGIIAVIIILLFLRDIKSTIISVISIPTSILMALLLLNWQNITLNIMTLGAMTVAIGRVIDDSIVVVENIYRRIHLPEERLRGRALVREATLEMFRPITSSTIVTVIVFAPLIFVSGMVGELFLPFALSMTFALLASLLVAITIVPALTHVLFRKKLYRITKSHVRNKENKLTNFYKGVLRWCLNHKGIVSLLSIVLLVGSLFLTPLIGFSFLGSEEEKVMYLTYTPGTNETLEETIENIETVEKELLKRDDIDILQYSISSSSDPMQAMMGGGGNGALMYIIFDPEMPNFPEVRDEIENYVFNLEQQGEWKSQNFTSMNVATNEVSYTFYSEDLDKLNEAVLSVEQIMNDVEGIKDVSSSQEEAFVEYTLKANQAQLLQYGLTTAQLVMQLNPMNVKQVLTTIEKDGNLLEVIVQEEQSSKPNSIEQLLAQPIPTQFGQSLSLSDLVEVEEGSTYRTLTRSKGKYYATVSGTITEKDIAKVSTEIDKKINALKLPEGVEIGVAGVVQDMEETFTQLGIAIIVAILFVYFVLVVTFSEGVAPFAILFSLPFVVIGSFIGLLLANETISVPVMMGFLMLIGIVVTNAIVLVDRIIHMERDGMRRRDAIIEAGATRLRPILMTAIATIGALIPLAIGTGGGGLISKGLAITVIGGLTSSTLLTLVIVPIVYDILSKIFGKRRIEREEDM